ncbi:hypothetical protein QWA68_015579 [Fusarium oxysporum]|nr:hypothetical protein QWA68_015579 [Fusarium oxysporum]
MFAHDLFTRNGINFVHVPCDDINESRFMGEPGKEDGLAPLIIRLDKALELEKDAGRKVAAILLANPENPLGRCYSWTVLSQVIDLCSQHGVHLVVDEIYAISGGPRFNSILSVVGDQSRKIVHILWGMSKDFGLGGIRLGFLATYNTQLYDTMRTHSVLNWVAAFSARVATNLLLDTQYFENYYKPRYHAALHQRRTCVRKALDAHGVGYFSSEAGFVMFVNLGRRLDNLPHKGHKGRDNEELDLLEYLMGNGVFLEPGQITLFSFTRLSVIWLRLSSERATSATI